MPRLTETIGQKLERALSSPEVKVATRIPRLVGGSLRSIDEYMKRQADHYVHVTPKLLLRVAERLAEQDHPAADVLLARDRAEREHGDWSKEDLEKLGLTSESGEQTFKRVQHVLVAWNAPSVVGILEKLRPRLRGNREDRRVLADRLIVQEWPHLMQHEEERRLVAKLLLRYAALARKLVDPTNS